MTYSTLVGSLAWSRRRESEERERDITITINSFILVGSRWSRSRPSLVEKKGIRRVGEIGIDRDSKR